MPRRKQTIPENALQSAVVGSLEVYFDRAGVHFSHHAPYANQQGHALNRYCADILGVVESALVILLEFKVFDCSKGRLNAFDYEQYADNQRFERIGVPIAYAYNAVENLPYFDFPRNNHPYATLDCVKRSPPSLLPDAEPLVVLHDSLLEWLRNAQTSVSTQTPGTRLFGQVLGAAMAPSALRNGVLALLYAVEENQFFALSDDDLRAVYDVLANASNLKGVNQATLRRVLREAEDVIQAFTPPPAPNQSFGPSP